MLKNNIAHPRDLVVIKLLNSIYRFKENGIGKSNTEFFRHSNFDRMYLEETYFGDVYFYDEETNSWMNGDDYAKKLMKFYGVKDEI